MHPNAQRVTDAAASAGVTIEVVTLTDGTRTADAAAAAVGVEVGQIVKSLAFAVDGKPVLALVSGSNRLDELKLADAADGQKVSRMDADGVRSATGFAIGGVSPFAHPVPIPIFADADLLGYAEVWAAAGTPDTVFAIAPDALVDATGALVTDLRAG